MSKKTNYSTVTKEVINNYNKWLKYSNLSEAELLKNRFLKPINIEVKSYDGITSVKLVIGNKSNSKTIGQPFISTGNSNEQFFVDLSFILLYIAERLDEANRASPPFGFHDKEYFYRTIRNQIKDKLIEF